MEGRQFLLAEIWRLSAPISGFQVENRIRVVSIVDAVFQCEAGGQKIKEKRIRLRPESSFKMEEIKKKSIISFSGFFECRIFLANQPFLRLQAGARAAREITKPTQKHD